MLTAAARTAELHHAASPRWFIIGALYAPKAQPPCRNLDFTLTGEFVELHNLLKLMGLADSGGSAKARVATGDVKVDGKVELRKTCKIRAGQSVLLDGTPIAVHKAVEHGGAAPAVRKLGSNVATKSSAPIDMSTLKQ